jgi:Cu-Zn family superoxide dismutase
MKQAQRHGSNRTAMAASGLALLLAVVAGGASAQEAEGELLGADGTPIGSVTLTEMAKGVHILVEASGLPAGVHAFHIHAVGICEPPFTSAGGHFNPTNVQHGWNNPEGHHAGDFPNVHIGEDGALNLELFTDAVTLGEGQTSLFDADGTSIVMHEGPDDYHTDPAGDAGSRIACAVVTPPR